MNISKVSFGQTFKFAKQKDVQKAQMLIQKTNQNAKLLAGESLPIDIVHNLQGDYFLLTNNEAQRYREIRAKKYEYNNDELNLSISQREILAGLSKQTQVDNLISTTYDGQNIAVKRGNFVLV